MRSLRCCSPSAFFLQGRSRIGSFSTVRRFLSSSCWCSRLSRPFSRRCLRHCWFSFAAFECETCGAAPVRSPFETLRRRVRDEVAARHDGRLRALVGSADIQSLADMANSFEVVRGMRVVPITWNTLVQLVVTTLLPVAPLLLTMISFEELLS